jgi:PKD repeat protein
MIDAARIAFRNNTFYLTPNSDYQDARFYAIQSAIDLFGACSPEVMATTNAWHAVGVGQVFSYTVNAQFSTAFQNYCQAPALVNFSNQSFNAGTFQWNFGDGGTSTALNPSHTYQNPGLYTVTLIASGGACGSDTTILVDYINVDPSLPCAITMNPSGANQNQSACFGTLFDPGGGAANYQDLVTSEITIAPTNAAFAKVPAKTMDELAKDSAKLKAVLTYHVIPGKVVAGDVKNGNVKTVNGANLALSKAGDFVTVEDGLVEKADVAATNGVVHVVDSVFIPPAR